MFREISGRVVLTAQSFNPSIFSQIWLVKNKIASEFDFSSDGSSESIFTNEVSQTVCDRFNLLILPPQLVFSPKVAAAEWGTLTNDIISKIVDQLPETPYTAMGINFDAIIEPRNTNSEVLGKQLFFSQALPFAKQFETEECYFGGYFSKPLFEGRLKLDVKPITVQSDGDSINRIILRFNFHRDIADNPIKLIHEHLSRFEEALSITETIVDGVIDAN